MGDYTKVACRRQIRGWAGLALGRGVDMDRSGAAKPAERGRRTGVSGKSESGRGTCEVRSYVKLRCDCDLEAP